MKSWIFSVCCVLCASAPAVIPQEKLTPQEAFFLRRVTEFWKDRDFELVNQQIDEFLTACESSHIHDNLYALKADIFYQSGHYTGALEFYDKISDPVLIDKVAGRKSQCLYLVGNYQEVIQILSPCFKKEKALEHTNEMEFIFADSLFRRMRESVDTNVRKELALDARPHLLSLRATSYQEKILLPLAEIHRELKENKEAIPLYLMLADKMPLQREELLLQAAVLQLEVEPKDAVSIFQKVVDLGGLRAVDAAYQELTLLYHHELYSELISRAPKLELYLSPDNRNLLDFCWAHSYFKIQQLEEAIHHYTRFIGKEKEATPHKRAAFLTLIQCAHKTDKQELFDQVVVQLLQEFPQDEEAGKALLLHAQVALQRGDIAQASGDLNRLLKEFPQFPDQETLLYDQALLLSKNQKWEESRSAFLNYLEKFPNTSHKSLIWIAIVHSSSQELKTASIENIQQKKAQLANDLTQALHLANLFSTDEIASYQFLLGQLMFELDRFHEALICLGQFCANFSHHHSAPEAYLLQALSHQALKSPPEQLIPALEKALQMTENTTYKTALRLNLFNAYLSTKQYEQAAETLYQVYMVDGTEVQQENQLWLAGHYLKKEERQKAIAIFKKVLMVNDVWEVHFDPAQTYLEGEVLKFTNLFSYAERESILKSLLELQNRHQNLPWKMKENTLLELAKTYCDLGKPEEALTIFETVLAKENLSPLVKSKALLEKSRLVLALIGASTSFNEHHPDVRNILATLKDLQIQKQLRNEPIHLEAALDYADLRTRFSPEISKTEFALFFLNRMKEDFYTKDDIIGQEYHEERLRYPEKDRLFQIYMKSLEAEILMWEGAEAAQKNDMDKAGHSKQVAEALFEEVLQEQEITLYLKKRIEHHLKNLK